MTHTVGGTIVLIDGPNLYGMAKSLGFDIDYKEWLKYWENHALSPVVRHYYFTAVAESDEYSSIRPLVDWLAYNGYTMVTKPTKSFVDDFGRNKVKGNMDVELAVTAMEMVRSGNVTDLVLVSGNGDFVPLVRAVKRMGVRVIVVSTIKSEPPMVADELRREADYFLDLDTMRVAIARKGARPEPRSDRRTSRTHERNRGNDNDEGDDLPDMP